MFANIAAFFAAMVTAIVLTAVMCRVAPRLGLVDKPDKRRKLHDRPIPLGGGLCIFGALSLVMLAVTLIPNPWNLELAGDWPNAFGLFAACACIVVVGLIDDRWGLRGRHKLLGQIMAAAILLRTGMLIERFEIFGTMVELGLLSVPFSLLWFVGAMNAVNLLDGIDGLATTIGVILIATLAVMAILFNHPVVGAVALVMTGSLLGFLLFNVPPARIFLGDSGSMLIGLMLAALSVEAALKSAGTVMLAAPAAVLLIPCFDTMAAIIRRKFTGRTIYATDRGHLHHCLMQQFGNGWVVLLVVGTACVVTCAGALASVYLKNDAVAVATSVAVVGLSIASGVFGRTELMLIVRKVRRALRPLACSLTGRRKSSGSDVVRLQGRQHWDSLWDELTASVAPLRPARIVLDINLPGRHEGYNAIWEGSSAGDTESQWTCEVPLVFAEDSVGRLVMTGQANGQTASRQMEQLVAMIQPFERRFKELIESETVSAPVTGRDLPAPSSPGEDIIRKHPH